jgi:MFS family permease
MMATASAPSPIYPLYRERWGFSVTMLTVIFAVYVAGLLGALLTVGSLSDHLGRRPVPVAALLVAAASTAIFWAADGVGSLLIARVAQGLATGTATDALAAGLVEFAPGERPHLRPTTTAVGTSVGLAIGAGAVGLLVQVNTHPDANAFPLLTPAFVSLAVVVLAIPEPHTRRAGGLASLRPRIRVPREARPEFLASVPAIVAGWSEDLAVPGAHPVPGDHRAARGVRRCGWLSIAVLFLASSAGGVRAVRHTPRVATSLGAVCLALGVRGTGSGPGAHLRDRLRHRLGHRRTGNRVNVQRNPPRHQRGDQREGPVGGVLRRLRDQLHATERPSLAAGLLARWWGLEATAYLYIAFGAVRSVIAAISRRTPAGSPAHGRRAIRDLRGRDRAPRAPRADPVLSPTTTHADERS